MAHTSVKISANSSDYQSQMKSAASQMKVLSSEFKLAQTQAKAFGSAADQLKAFQSTLPSQGATANMHIKFLCDPPVFNAFLQKFLYSFAFSTDDNLILCYLH